MNNTRRIAILSLLTALTVILAKLLAINLQFVRIGVEFVSIALGSILFGPAWGALSAVLADILGGFLFPTGPYSPLISIVAVANGLIYGFFLYNKEITARRTVFTVLTKAFVSDFLLMSIALYVLYKIPIDELFIARSIKTAAVIIIETLIIYFVLRPVRNILYKKGWIIPDNQQTDILKKH
ncbi:MAG TPA: folate family ECF transporter S component [Clostridia bacterium]|nr:MAG: Folate transporter FolT [Firmicutes bacterium ADurb.Bin146]HOD93078.1 folate family ECF transporter S component [Clostridia bacterium]HQM39401.1 folate family ECF transporter S component [Clostridia bacterium]